MMKENDLPEEFIHGLQEEFDEKSDGGSYSTSYSYDLSEMHAPIPINQTR